MRIEFKKSDARILYICTLGFLAVLATAGLPLSVAAQGVNGTVLMSPAAPMSVDAPTGMPPIASMAATAPPSAAVPPPVAAAPPSSGGGDQKSLTSLENKVSDSVKDVVKTLSSPAEKVTLDDLNSAKIAIAKIDVLIDIEKKMAELEKIRGEREGRSAPMSIPASALAAPLPRPVSVVEKPRPAPPAPMSHIEVVRV